jgi:cell division protein YceG involved in septum cleavage
MGGGHYSAFFKVARVTPVFKSEDPTEFSNYRPISVLPVLSQVFERVLQTRLLEFLDLQGVINPGQYGFRADQSTEMVIQDMMERVRGGLE